MRTHLQRDYEKENERDARAKHTEGAGKMDEERNRKLGPWEQRH